MNYLNSGMSNSTNTLIHFDLYLRLQERLHKFYAMQDGFSIIYPAISDYNSSTCAFTTGKFY